MSFAVLFFLASNLNVADFGAKADALHFTCETAAWGITNASISLSSGDVGKIIELFSVGPATSGTNHQDYIGVLTNANGSLSQTPSVASAVSGVIGTDNCAAFRAAIAACTSNDVVTVPAGTYLIMPPFMLTNGVHNALPICTSLIFSRGGVTLRGEPGAVLLSCGAWQLHNGVAYRGKLIDISPPITYPSLPIVLDNITFDGGLAAGYTSNHSFPASATTGEGWDETHNAVYQRYGTPILATATFSNCTFQHWRGEILIGQSTPVGWLTITNCTFSDGNASGFNSAYGHRISNCLFTGLYLTTETWQGYNDSPCFFENCIVTNVENGIVLNGALTNHFEPLYTISGNDICTTNGIGLLLSPARNLLITGNTFRGGCIQAGGAGHQGSDINSDYTISGNLFRDQGPPPFYNGDVMVCSNVLFSGNLISNRQYAAIGYGEQYAARFSGNTATNCQFGNVNSTPLSGQWFYDDGSNSFPAWQESDTTGQTNSLTYAYGVAHKINRCVTGSLWLFDDSEPNKIPNGATLNVLFSGPGAPVIGLSSTTYPNCRTLNPTVGWQRHFHWSGSRWIDDSVISVGSVTAGSLRSQ